MSKTKQREIDSIVLSKEKRAGELTGFASVTITYTSGYKVVAGLSRKSLAKFIIEAAQVLKNIEKLEVHG
jgi:hypothetical protein